MNADDVRKYVATKWPASLESPVAIACREVERSGEFAGFSNTELLTAFRMPWSTAAREKLRSELIARGVDPNQRTGDRRE